MDTTMGLAYLLLLLGSAAAFPDRKLERSDSDCEAIFVPVNNIDDSQVEECLQNPDITAVADGFTGADGDKNREIILQCELNNVGSFTEGAADPDKVKDFFEMVVQEEPYGASYIEGLNACFSILQEPYQILSYLECVRDYC